MDIDEKLPKYPFQPFPAGTGFRFPIRKADEIRDKTIDTATHAYHAEGLQLAVVSGQGGVINAVVGSRGALLRLDRCSSVRLFLGLLQASVIRYLEAIRRPGLCPPWGWAPSFRA